MRFYMVIEIRWPCLTLNCLIECAAFLSGKINEIKRACATVCREVKGERSLQNFRMGWVSIEIIKFFAHHAAFVINFYQSFGHW